MCLYISTPLIMEMPEPTAYTILVKTLYFQRLVQVSNQRTDINMTSLLSKVSRKQRIASDAHGYFTSFRILGRVEEEPWPPSICLLSPEQPRGHGGGGPVCAWRFRWLWSDRPLPAGSLTPRTSSFVLVGVNVMDGHRLFLSAFPISLHSRGRFYLTPSGNVLRHLAATTWRGTAGT